MGTIGKASEATMHYLLLYDLAPDYIERRQQFRNEHLRLGWLAQARGELVLAGPFADPPDTAVFMFRGDSPAAAEAFAKSDPYVRNGIVTKWRIRTWTTVIGDDATTPVRPEST